PKLYDGSVIEKSDAIVIPDTEETLMLAKESRLKMIEKQNDPQVTEKKVITKPIDYAIINQLSTDFETRFLPQTELSAEQAFWITKNVNEILTTELERYKDQVRILKEENNVDKASETCAQSLEIDNLKHTLSEHLKKIFRTNDYAALNQLLQDFETRFVRQAELSAEQVFWSQNSRNSEEPNLSLSTAIVEVPKELPKVSMVNSSLKKLKFHLTSFDVVVKERTTATAITKGTWGFEHTKACFWDDIIPFVKALKDLFNSFDQFLIDELTEVQNVFN
nr:hypothetical protein [Tanacetum cinerariifolium]